MQHSLRRAVAHGMLRIIVALAALAASTTQPSQRVVTDASAIQRVQLAVAEGGPAVGKRDPKLQPIALFYGAMPAGVAVSRDGRIFVSFPWDGAAHVAEIRDGALAPILPREDSRRSIQGMDIDERNRLWLLDPGAGRLLAMDLKSNQIGKRIELSQDVRKTSFYANDVRVDARRGKDGFAYISDSVGGGVIIVDLGSGERWRRLQHAL